MHEVWTKAQTAVLDVLSETSFAELVCEPAERREGRPV
jgi:hypothetical protein